MKTEFSIFLVHLLRCDDISFVGFTGADRGNDTYDYTGVDTQYRRVTPYQRNMRHNTVVRLQLDRTFLMDSLHLSNEEILALVAQEFGHWYSQSRGLKFLFLLFVRTHYPIAIYYIVSFLMCKP